MPTLRTLARGTLFLAGLSCVVALLVEQCFRFYLFGFAALSYEKIDSVIGIGKAAVLRTSDYRDVVYELKPNLNTWLELAPLRTNSQGLADYEYAQAKPPDTFRIVLLGASYSMPTGVALDDSWQQVLENRLNARGDGRRYEVINFAVAGYDPLQFLALLKHRAIAYDPDLILVDMTLKSAELIRREEVYRKAFVVQPRSHPFWHSFAVERLWQILRNPGPNDRLLPPREPTAAFQQSLDDLRGFAAEHRTPLCFVILQHDPRLVQHTAILRDQVSRGSSCVIDTFPGFRNEHFFDLMVLRIDTHPNARAQAIFAREVYAFLVAHGMLGRRDDAGERTPRRR
jgi:hypothetical protein